MHCKNQLFTKVSCFIYFPPTFKKKKKFKLFTQQSIFVYILHKRKETTFQAQTSKFNRSQVMSQKPVLEGHFKFS